MIKETGMLQRLYVVISILYISILYLVIFIGEKQFVIKLGEEDGFIESFGAVCFLMASIVFILLFLRSQRGNDFILFKTPKNIFFLLLGLAFFFAAGEEISWGQRILHFETPELLDSVNMQDEFNIHNINIFHNEDVTDKKKPLLALLLNFNVIFNLFCLLYCGLIPVLSRFSKLFERLIKRINLPLVPISLGGIFVLVIFLLEITEWYVVDDLKTVVFEMKESNLAFLFMISSLYFLSDSFHKRQGLDVNCTHIPSGATHNE